VAWWQYILLGTGGGALAEALALLKWVLVWQNERRKANGRLKGRPPRWSAYIDLPVHTWLLVIRMPLGAGTAWLFGATGQIDGPYAALAFGLAAPAVLAQFGSFPALSTAVQGKPPVDRSAFEYYAKATEPVDEVGSA
jgi:hypothetical protein